MPAGQPRSKVEFADLCGSLEDLIYLGEGSNGVVYSASWHGARVAVKFLLGGSDDDGTYLQRCLTEAVLTRLLSHPCVVQCFATAMARLSAELWSAIRDRCRRHASILQSSSLGRCVAAAVAQQEQQERSTAHSSCCNTMTTTTAQGWGELHNSEQHQQRAQQQQQQQLQMLQSGDRRRSLQINNLRSQSSLVPSRQSPRQTPNPPLPPPLQQQQQPLPPSRPLSQPSQSLSHSQAQVVMLPSQDRLSPGFGGTGGGGGGRWAPGGGSGVGDSSDVTIATAAAPAGETSLVDLQRMTTFFAEELNHMSNDQPPQPSQLPSQQQQQQRPQQQPLNLTQQGQRPISGGVGSLDFTSEEALGAGGGGGGGGGGGSFGGGGCGVGGGGSGEGISLMQALLDLKAEAGRHCTVVVMEYMDAGTLHQAIMRGDFSARRSSEHRSRLLALLLTAQELAQGMAHLHAQDILHGDLKPTNVLLKGSPCAWGPPPGGMAAAGGLTSGGGGVGASNPASMATASDPRGYTAKIADLGLARPCSGETAELSSDQWGALAYLAPEAAKGSCCKASDVYSFGVMLWEMAAGVRPYLGLTTPQVLLGLVTGQLQLTWPSDGSLYGPLRSLAIACTDFTPSERPTFEVAARILGRMVRHIRSAAEPLRQRHSSALSMEAATAAAAAAAAAAMGPRGGAAGAAASSFHSPGSTVGGGGGVGGRCVLNHASRSMPIYLPTAAAGGGGGGGGLVASAMQTGPMTPATPSGAGLRALVSPSSVSAANLASSIQSCGGGGTDGGGGGSSDAAAAGAALGGGGGAAAAGAGPGTAAGTFWAAAAAHLQPFPQTTAYPRTRRAAGGGVCGGAVFRSPLGGDAATAGGGGGLSSVRAVPSAPCGDPRVGGAYPPQLSVALRAAPRYRPGSSPAHSHVMEATEVRAA